MSALATIAEEPLCGSAPLRSLIAKIEDRMSVHVDRVVGTILTACRVQKPGTKIHASNRPTHLNVPPLWG